MWNAIDFGEEMSRCEHIRGVCLVYDRYMLVVFFVYTCTELIMLTAGLFGSYPSSSILHCECDNNYDVAESLFDPDSIMSVCDLCVPGCSLAP